VKKGSRFEEQVELAKAAAHWFGAGDVLDAREEIGERLVAAGGAGAKEEFVGILETKSDRIAVIQKAAFDLFAVDEQPAPLPAVFDVKSARFGNQRGAISRDAAVGKLQMIAGFGPAAYQERRLRDAHIAPSAVRRDDFKDCSAEGDRSCIGHEMFATGL